MLDDHVFCSDSVRNCASFYLASSSGWSWDSMATNFFICGHNISWSRGRGCRIRSVLYYAKHQHYGSCLLSMVFTISRARKRQRIKARITAGMERSSVSFDMQWSTAQTATKKDNLLSSITFAHPANTPVNQQVGDLTYDWDANKNRLCVSGS